MHSVIQYLDKTNPEAASAARRRYGCFEDFGDDPQTYGMLASQDPSASCENDVVQQLSNCSCTPLIFSIAMGASLLTNFFSRNRMRELPKCRAILSRHVSRPP